MNRIPITYHSRNNSDDHSVPETKRIFEIRCPVHGFIPFDEWERDIINHPAFQRLRRIRQLAWTDQVYPGAMHTRFEHSLGVMHIASQLFDAVCKRSKSILESRLEYSAEGLKRDRVIVRLAALLHDTGHAPFSHAGEGLFPIDPKSNKTLKHEAYSAAIIRNELKGVIDDHPYNKRNLGITADQIAGLLEGSAKAEHRVFWRELIDGQMDADRMDYLLRDSLHAGVDYGRYDWRRLLNTIQAIEIADEGDAPQGLRLGVTRGGIHAAEALVLARYYMFTQVYFHKTRVAYDYHIRHALKELLGGKQFPPPTSEGLKEYLLWDDWRVLGELAAGKGGEHGQRLSKRNHYREVYDTPERAGAKDLARLKKVRRALADLVVAQEESKTSTYKLATSDIVVVTEDALKRPRPLSHYSSVVRDLNRKPLNIIRLYSKPENADSARAKVAELMKDFP